MLLSTLTCASHLDSKSSSFTLALSTLELIRDESGFDATPQLKRVHARLNIIADQSGSYGRATPQAIRAQEHLAQAEYSHYTSQGVADPSIPRPWLCGTFTAKSAAELLRVCTVGAL